MTLFGFLYDFFGFLCDFFGFLGEMRHNAISNNRTVAWVTRTGCPKVAKDEVKQARQLEVGVPKTSISHFSTSPILGGMKQTLIFHPMVYGFRFY